MVYPICLLREQERVAPLFGDQLEGEPHLFDLSSKNPASGSYPTTDFDAFQRQVFAELEASGRSWGVARYLEERGLLLRAFPQMVEEGRVYHAGLDVVVPEGYALYAPVDAVVHFAGVDPGPGNYGGVVVLRHEVGGDVFYSLYGHLDLDHQVAAGDRVARGEPFGKIGAGEASGGWFTHTHLQVLTPEAVAAGRMLHGYATAEDLKRIEDLFPSPYPLFRFCGPRTSPPGTCSMLGA